MSDFKPYLHSAHIEGYKSIVNCDVTFKPGLNIIIGKNGTGKTNLLEAVNGVINSQFETFLANLIEAELQFILDEHAQRLSVKLSLEDDNVTEVDDRIDRINVLEKRRQVEFNSISSKGELSPIREEDSDGIFLSSLLFSFSIPEKIPLLDDLEAGWFLDKTAFKVGVVSKLRKSVFSNQLFRIQRNLRIFIRKGGAVDDSEKVFATINDLLEPFAKKLTPVLRSCTPITNIQLVQGRLFPGSIQNQFSISGFHFLFEINGTFQPFQNLSDGTKRIVLIAADLSSFRASSIEQFDWEIGTFLLEEPELGIHPHQLHLLMNFIKDQSKEKQIIITTHSPQVLDILNKDELDRIIIAEFDSKKGSTFRHLTEKEVKKAQFIMKEEPLSSYWKHSDLERSLVIR